MSLLSIRSWFAKGNRAQWCTAIAFAVTIFVKNVLFYETCYHSLLFSSLFSNPTEFFVFYGVKVLPAIFLMAIMLLTRRIWWTIVVSCIIDIWCVTNILYYIFFNMFFTWDVLALAGNMDGFWNSLLPYLDMKIWIYPLITLLYVILVSIVHVSTRHNNWFLTVVILCIVGIGDIGMNSYRYQTWYSATSSEACAWESLNEESMLSWYMPFGLYRLHGLFTDNWSIHYVKAQSISSYFVASLIDYARKYIRRKPHLTDKDIIQLSQYVNTSPRKCSPHYNLVFVLVESLESWPLLDTIEGNIITPNMNRFIMESNTLYCPYIKSQIKKGGSGDGQMIVNTGLLPILEGAACTSYGNNVFPNYAHYYPNSAIINPTPNAWNQSHVTYSYGYKQLVESNRLHDIDVIHKLDSLLNDSIYQLRPSCVLAITMDSHSPFVRPGGTMLSFTEDVPTSIAFYLDCINYVDSCLGDVFATLNKDNTILVITGDHIIFKDFMLAEFATSISRMNLCIKEEKNYCPLLIYSPSFTSSTLINDTCYQMDIYPTIMHLIGCDDYYWKGLGVNLLDSAARHNRPITEQEAYRLSDLMIRSNYFRQYLYK